MRHSLRVIERILGHLGLWQEGVPLHSGTDPPGETTPDPDDLFPDYDTEPVPHLNSTRHTTYGMYFTPESAAVVYDLWKADFETFGYSACLKESQEQALTIWMYFHKRHSTGRVH
jgi:hypothetical protein